MVKKYTFKSLFGSLKRYKKQLIYANIIAVFATVINTPVPLLMPLLVDEVLLDKPGVIISSVDFLYGDNNPAYVYVIVMLCMTLFMRIFHFVLNYFQTKYFMQISKNITYEIRKNILNHLEKVSLSGY